MTLARHAEADRASVAFQIALTELGVETLEDALILWDGVSPTNAAATSGAWLRGAVRLIMRRRSRSRDLAMAYYRLVRALRTGRTVADPHRPEPRYVTMQMLRYQFSLLAGPDRPDVRTGELPADDLDVEGESEDEALDRILVEEIDGLQAEQERVERAAEEEARIDLEQLGPNGLERRLEGVDGSDPADDVDAARDEAHRASGTRQAAAAERITMNGARSALWTLASEDDRAIGYIRLSRTGTPCGWCAMLISRGPVYRSKKSATYSDGDMYHDNCHCYAMPVFSREQYATSDLYALNRRYEKEWPEVTRGYSGKAALRVWRRHIRRERQQAAQAAA